MHLNILNKDQQQLLPLLSKFKKEFYMVGGTAIALHIGHRMSIDFDLFKNGKIKPKAIINKFQEQNEVLNVTLNIDGQLNLNCRNVKFTFFEYEFDIPHPVTIENSIFIPELLDLAAMEAYALGSRSKWKDYVDLYFILKDHYSIAEIATRAEHIYHDLFSEKLFRGQLNYFTGINFEELVDFIPGFETDETIIKEFLIDAALTGF
jgi:hypothetical protein